MAFIPPKNGAPAPVSIPSPRPSGPVKPVVSRPIIIRDEPLTPPAVMLLGDIGSGKTHSIISALKAGLEVFVIITENTGVETLIDACKKERVSMERLHWRRCTPTQQGWDVMKAQAKLTNNNSVGELQKMETGLDRFKYPGFMKLLEACEDFVCDRTKEHFGDVMTWGDNRLLALDSMSGLSEITSSHITGHRITMTQPEFGVVQNHIYQLCNTLCGLNCYFLLTGHIEMESDEAKGITKFMVSTVGRKLAPKLPRVFSEVVYAKVDNGKYLWSTDDSKVITKNRALPRGVFPADFKVLVDIYEKRKLEAQEELEAAKQPSE